MAKPQRRPMHPPASMANLPTRAAEALEQGRFREAIDLFKHLVRQEPRPDWKTALDDAYCGRARALAAKQMFKEAAMVLENTRTGDGTLREPMLYATCLIRDGQQPKAATQLLHSVCSAALPGNERPALEALLAALLTANPLPPAAICPEPPERARWREGATAARQALTAWIDGVPAEGMEPLLGRISLRSAFRPVRLLLKSLVAGPQAAGRSRVALETIAADSPFFPFRLAVEAALGAGYAADGWSRLTPPQRGFVAETGGLPAASIDVTARLSEAAANGPAALFAALQRLAGDGHAALNRADLRGACLNLLPHIPDRIGAFEKQFGRLSTMERARIEALAAEAGEDWAEAEAAWRRAAGALAEGGGGQLADLSRAVIYRHLAELAARAPQIEGVDEDDDPVSSYLARAALADPEHVPTVLARIARYRSLSRDQDWHRLAEEAAQRFPQDSQVLLQATQSAVARQAYKKAAGFARRLLAIDPINPELRRQMVELKVAHARKQMGAKRPDLAARELEEATQWERADAPSALLRLFRGLVAVQAGKRDAGEPLVRQGVDLAGGGVGGWFRVVLEATLAKIVTRDVKWLSEELARAREAPPVKQDVLAVVAALGTSEAVAGMRAVLPLLAGMNRWLMAAADLDWSEPECQTVEDTLVRYEQFGVLLAMARAGRRREPGNQLWRFHEILARTCNDYRRLTIQEEDDLDTIGQAASDRKDAHFLARLRRYLRMQETMNDRMAPDFDDFPQTLDAHDQQELLRHAGGPLPKDIARELRAMVGQIGRAAATEAMAQSLANSPAGRAIPLALARRLAELMVKSAMDGGAKAGRGGRL